MTKILVAGAGQAACQLAISLRQGGFEGAIDLYGEEAHPPYERPPLSKAVLKGEQEPARTFLRPETFYREQHIGLHLGQRLCADALPDHDVLVLATGMRPRVLPGYPEAKVHVLRSLEDTARLQRAIQESAKVLILGAGFIGLEVAAALSGKVASIDVYDLAAQVMGRAAAPPVAAAAQAALESKGVAFHMGASITPEAADAYDLILMAVGGVANDDLAADLGLCEPGQLKVDLNGQVLRSAAGTPQDDQVPCYAIGDVAIAAHDFLDQPLRLESVDQAVYGAKCVAAHILGQARPTAAAPWFWSFQGDWKLQMVGIWTPDLRVVPFGGTPGGEAFSLFGFSGDRLQAVQCVNRAADFAAARRLVGKDLPGFENQITALDFKLKQLF